MVAWPDARGLNRPAPVTSSPATTAPAVAGPSRAPTALVVAVWLASFAAVYLQVGLMKLASLKLNPLFVFGMIGVALLGHGAAGSLLALRGRVGGTSRLVAPCLLAFAILTPASLFAVNAVDVPAEQLFGSVAGLPLLMLVYALLTLPFLGIGLALAASFADHPDDANRLYFADLVGAGLGSALAVATFPLVGGAPLVPAAAAVAAIGAAAAARARGASAAPGTVLGVVLASLALWLAVWQPLTIRVAPDKHGPALGRIAKPGGLAIEHSEWSRFGRIDVTEPFEGLSPQFGGDISPVIGATTIEQRMTTLDGAAPAFLWRVPPEGPAALAFLPGTSQSAAYLLREKPRVLVIGVGGASDVLIALGHGATAVTGVEINPVSARLVREVYAEYLGNPFGDPRVELIVAEGRNFAAREQRRFDVIQLSGVDTGASLGAWGLGTMPESYVYTVEAFGDFLARLEPDGIFSITRDLRFRWAHRAAAVARAALLADGLDPAERIAVIGGGYYQWATLLVKRSPFTDAERARLRAFSDQWRFPLLYLPGGGGTDPLMAGVVQDGADRDGPTDLRPSTDDWPFFFANYRWWDLARIHLEDRTSLANPLQFLMVNVLVLTLAAVALIGWPLVRLRAAWRDVERKGSVVVYFALLGVGFILVEVALMQRFTIFLGDPVLSAATVLAALLVSSGIGSALGRRWQDAGRPVLSLAIAWIVVVQIVLGSALARSGIDGLLGLPLAARLAITVAVVALAGVPMGMPFPAGLRRLGARAPALVPWAWGINGMLSVTMALASYLLGMVVGFGAMFHLGALLYACVLPIGRRV